MGLITLRLIALRLHSPLRGHLGSSTVKLTKDLFEASKAERIKEHLARWVGADKGKVKLKAQYRAKRRQMRQAGRAALRVWRVEQRELMGSYSRKQLLKTMVPEAGQKKKKKKTEKLEEGASKKKAKALREHLSKD